MRACDRGAILRNARTRRRAAANPTADEAGDLSTSDDGVNNAAACSTLTPKAEGEGFEPSSDETARNGFRDRRIRPLCHPSERCARTQRSGENGRRKNGEGGIRTLEGGLFPLNALAGRRLQPLGHFSAVGAWYRRGQQRFRAVLDQLRRRVEARISPGFARSARRGGGP